MSGCSIHNSSTPHRAVRAAYNSIGSIASTGIGPNPTKLIVVTVVPLGNSCGASFDQRSSAYWGAVETPTLSNDLNVIRHLAFWSKPRAPCSVWQPEDIRYHQHGTLLLAAKINADMSDLGCG
jgi:hypothetical protein